MKLSLINQRLAICRLAPGAAIPVSLLDTPFCALTRTDDELSIVLPEDKAEASWRIDGGWGALKVIGPLAFDMVGVLAALSVPLAEAGLPVFVISTFDTDYILIKQEGIEKACIVLREKGHEIA